LRLAVERAIEEREHTVETNGRTIEGGEIKSTHDISSFRSDMQLSGIRENGFAEAKPRGRCSRMACTERI
jgi:hypothetical protein